LASAALILPADLLVRTALDANAATEAALRQGALLWKLSTLLLGLALAATGALLQRAAPPEDTLPGEGAGERTPWWVLGSILVLAGVLRAIRLDSGLWYDEVVTLVEFVRLPTTQVLTTYTALNNHILFSLGAHWSTALFGESAWALRLPAAVFGVASIWALWRLALLVVGNRQAVLAALLLTLSYHHLWFSQNARGYTGLLLWTLLATSLFLTGMRRRARGLWLVYAVVLAAAMYTHLSAVFVFASHGLVYLFLLVRGRLIRPVGTVIAAHPGAIEWWPLLGFALGGLLTIDLYSITLPQMFQAFSAQAGEQSVNVKVTEWTSLVWTALEVVRSAHLGPTSVAAMLAAAIFGVVGLISLARRDPVFTSLIVIHVPLTLLVLRAISFHIWPRYFFVDIGFATLVLVHGAFASAELLVRRLDLRERWQTRVPQVGTALAVALVVTSALSLPANYRVPKQDYAGARDLVESLRTPGDVVVTAGLASLPYERYYAPEWRVVEDLAELEAIRRYSERAWLVYSFPTYMRAVHSGILERVQAEFDVVRVFPGSLGDGDIYVCRSRDR
jgi:hypothetical protein